MTDKKAEGPARSRPCDKEDQKMALNGQTVTRKEIIDRILETVMQGITIEQYERSKAYLEGLTDAEFDQFMAQMAYLAGLQESLTPKEYFKALEKLRDHNGLTAENTAMNRYPIRYLEDGENSELWKTVCSTAPTDHIFLKTRDDEAMCGLWKQGRSIEKGGIPSDLFFAGKVALHDCRIVVDETDLPEGRVCGFRVVIFPDYRERIEGSVSGSAYVGAIIPEGQGDRTFFIPIAVTEGLDYISISACGHHNIPKAQMEASKKTTSMQDVMNMAYAYMSTWYGIQIALLHPMVQEVFRRPKVERVYDPKPTDHRKRKRVTRYVKKHVINADEVRKAASGKGQEYTRHALVWYVIGHWRNYANGKKVFIQPYWKGTLRHLKMELDGRERQIIIKKEDE